MLILFCILQPCAYVICLVMNDFFLFLPRVPEAVAYLSTRALSVLKFYTLYV